MNWSRRSRSAWCAAFDVLRRRAGVAANFGSALDGEAASPVAARRSLDSLIAALRQAGDPRSRSRIAYGLSRAEFTETQIATDQRVGGVSE